MACFSYNKLWESGFDNIVSTKDKMQDININQLKLEVHDTYKEDEKITLKIEPSNPKDVLKKSFRDPNLPKKQGHISYIEKDYNEFKLHNNKPSLEDFKLKDRLERLYKFYMIRVYLIITIMERQVKFQKIFCLLKNAV